MTKALSHLPPETEADLVALADGRLHPDRVTEVQARVAADPALAAELAAQRAALGAIAAATAAVSAPSHLDPRAR